MELSTCNCVQLIRTYCKFVCMYVCVCMYICTYMCYTIMIVNFLQQSLPVVHICIIHTLNDECSVEC